MNIKVTITKVLDDTTWGFSDLLNGRRLDNYTREEIKELIMEDYSEIIEDGVWTIEKAD